MPRARPMVRILRLKPGREHRERSPPAMTRSKKPARFLIPSLLAAGFTAHDPARSALPQAAAPGTDDPNKGDVERVFTQDHLVTLGNNWSHSSHASHSSGGYGGGHSSHVSHASHSSGGYGSSPSHSSHVSHTSH